MMTQPISDYIKSLNEQYATGKAREHSYRPALANLIKQLLPTMVITNEPSRISCGAPDYIITSKGMPVAFIEAKDINDGDLDGQRQHREQFTRYKNSLQTIIFTDYLDFHLYENGELRQTVRLAEVSGKKIQLIKGNMDAFIHMIDHIAQGRMQPITSAQNLARQMAAKARLMCRTIEEIFKNEAELGNNGQLRGQFEAFRRVLIHDLDEASFADIYAQTIAYGLFTARLNDTTPEDFSRQEAAVLIPKSNPFLRKIFQQIAGFDLDERISWIVDDLVGVFLATDLDAVLKQYRNDPQHNDPMMHFYEDFLAAYSPSLRKSKGVWYTPQPVVRFIVRAVDEILRQDFGLSLGLADYSKVKRDVAIEQSLDKRTNDHKKHEQRSFHRVQILDPATGTGTFLAETIRQIHAKFQGQEGLWPSYVGENLIPRLNGFEILMASYAVAHLKIEMLLKLTGVDLSATAMQQAGRLRIYLTNSLEQHYEDVGTLFSQWLSNEANEASRIKRDTPVMVMIGNPPYSVSSSNNGAWITNLIADYKKNLNERNIQPLSDDYIKFIRLGQHYVKKNGQGILGFITNNSFLDGLIHRQMRHSLLEEFDKIYIVNLHGSTKRKETTPDGSKDENVFDIQQGVCINIMVKVENLGSKMAKVYYCDLYGLRDDKYHFLDNNSISSMQWTELDYQSPSYFLVPKNFKGQEEYEKGFKINELFRTWNSGIKTQRDNASIFLSEQERNHLLDDFINLPVDDLREKYHFKDSRDWQLPLAKEDILQNNVISPMYCYRPFDDRHCIYTGKTKGIMGYPRYEFMKYMLAEDNVSLLTCRQVSTFDFQHAFVSTYISDMCSISSQTKETCYVFPLYISVDDGRRVNFSAEIWQKINSGLGEKTEPQELFDYIYAVLHSPTYRERYKEFLKIDFPRIPYPADATSYHTLAALGAELRHLHLMHDSASWQVQATYPQAGSNAVEKLERQDDRVYINAAQYFGGVDDEAWNFFIGGYQPAQKWLKDRRGRMLDFHDIRHYEEIIHALKHTASLMSEIDQLMQ